MAQKTNILDKVDDKLVDKFKDNTIQHSISTKLDFHINIAGTELNNIEDAVNYAYRCGLSASGTDQIKKGKEGKGGVDQD